MENNEEIKILLQCEALLQGHFLLSSGLHSDGYCQCAKLMQYPKLAEKVLNPLSKRLKEIDFDVIVGPAMGGIVVAYELGRLCDKRAIFTEREDGNMTLRRGFTIEKGERVIISEDVVTTGKSSLETAKVIEELGGIVVGIACIADRHSGELPYPLYSAVKLNISAYSAEQCPLCKQNMKLVKPGSRKFNK